MINWLVVVLVLLNLGVFAWGLQREHLRHEPSVEIESGIPRLVLVEEQQMMQDETAAAGAIATTAQGPGDPVVAEASINTKPDMIVSDAQATPPWKTATDPLSEQVPAEPIAETPIPASPPEAYCYTLGAFQKRDQAEVVLAQLQPLATAADIRREVQRQEIGYWVLIPPMKSESEAIEKFQELKDAGVTDVWRFTRGTLANAISLGLFVRQNLAQAHSEDISSKGFVTEVRPRLAERSTYWIDARFGEDQDMASGVWVRITDDYSGIETVTAECDL